ncbi:hypothetical protein DSL64_07380 [Dyadobacter luteus]|uniref:Uncharacterized protein n=1 Tax=Dyadobacter luteus TaxID=2259619 RepID=A0A3D8YDV6_9BACT|nr:hypothetical protein [Dyadobacter luteus]REA62737.1 hypothetical protein DSL64_07380 [Dyadobacter luteus]
MARQRGEPAILERSKAIGEPPVFPDVPTNTQPTRKPADDPDLLRKSEDESKDEEEQDLD